MKLSMAFFIYITAISLISFAMFGIDKHRAQSHAWRISEAALMLSAILGGSIGSLLGMRVFHHKTKHPKFFIGIPVILALQAGFLIWFRYFSGISVVFLP